MSSIQLSLNMKIGMQSPPTKQLYRVLHDVELPPALHTSRLRQMLNRWMPRLFPMKVIRSCAPCPEVYPMDALRSPFGLSWQLLAFALNPGMTGGHFRSLYGDATAFTNGTGFALKAGQPIHADYVNSRDLSYPDPAFEKSRLCGGATVTGTEDSTYLTVDVLDSTNPAPLVDDLLMFPTLYFHATIVTSNGIRRFPQMNGAPVLVPLIGRKGARIPLYHLQKVPAIADPYYIGYRPSPYV